MPHFWWRVACLAVVAAGFWAAPARAAFVIVPTFTGVSQPAQDAFNRAIQAWTSRITTNITVNIDVSFANLGSSVLGQASTSLIETSYSSVQAKLAARSSGAGLGILASLPSGSLPANLPSGVSLSGNLLLTTANAKALGYTGLSGPDSMIQFSSTFAFDFDRSNGVASNQTDFESVAIHEIGHALGFVSGVDDLAVASPPATVSPTTWDLFRFNNSTLPTDAASFAGTNRELRPGQAASFSDTTNAYPVSTGVTGGDGNQASHWKADELNGGLNIGVMDPTLAKGAMFDPTAADFRVLEVIGYDVTATPEPATALGLAAGGLGGVWVVRRRATRTPPALAA